jgi:membrane protein YqaA with SNARE-associated domain
MMDKRLEGAMQILLAIIIIALVFYFSDKIAQLKEYGYLGAFVISALSSATIFFPAPGWAVIAAMGRYMDPYLLGIAAGLGSAIGELTGYVAGDGARDILSSRIKETKDIQELVRRYGLFAIFFFAFIPNPLFDIAGIVSGALKIPWWQFLLACAAGRILRYILLAVLGNYTLGLIS